MKIEEKRRLKSHYAFNITSNHLIFFTLKKNIGKKCYSFLYHVSANLNNVTTFCPAIETCLFFALPLHSSIFQYHFNIT